MDFFDDRTAFRAKGLHGTSWNCNNFISIFDDRTAFRAKGLRGTAWNRNFTSVFGDRTSFRAKGLRGTSWNRKFTSAFDDRTSFRAKELRFAPYCLHCPCPRLQKRNRKEGEGKRARGEDVKRRRCEDEKMWRWASKLRSRGVAQQHQDCSHHGLVWGTRVLRTFTRFLFCWSRIAAVGKEH